jgi:hypothetical protein
MTPEAPPKTALRRIGRSIFALVIGILAGILLSVGTDLALHGIGVAPSLAQRWPDRLLVLATAYRTLYGVIASYILARLAPSRPLLHALIGGFLGLVVNSAAAIGTWNGGLGPHWYPVALAVLSVPPAWVGGKIREMQVRTQSAATTGS